MSTNGKTVHAVPLQCGYDTALLDKQHVLAWLFNARREIGFKTASSQESKYQMEGAQSAINTLIRAINSGAFDVKNPAPAPTECASTGASTEG